MATTESEILAVTGNEAVAEAMGQIDPDVVCAYPITPQTEVVQLYAQMVADGKVSSEFVTVESEHSAMSAVIGSAAGGARTMTATSSQGFALMWEVLFIAASYNARDYAGAAATALPLLVVSFAVLAVTYALRGLTVVPWLTRR